jgi:hypothetical protein
VVTDDITGAVPDADADIRDSGGNYTLTDRTWERDRTEFINDMATDGALDVYFDATGTFVIRTQPVLNPDASVWTFRTGDASGNILTADRERPFDRLYNTVVINPIDETQTWSVSIFELTDVNHPRHKSKVGVVPYFYSSPTLTTQAAVNSAGETLLQRIQGITETLSITALGVPLEVGDTVTVVHPATATDPGFNAVHFVDSWDYNLVSGDMTVKTRSTDLAELTES